MRRFGSALPLLMLGFMAACVDTRNDVEPPSGEPPVVMPIRVAVTVDFTASLAEVPKLGLGMHSSVYDNDLHEPTTPDALNEAGVGMLRYPGGGYSDNYHWSVHRLSLFHSGGKPSTGYLPASPADRTDFPSFMRVVESFGGVAMVTVNYGTNLKSAPKRGPCGDGIVDFGEMCDDSGAEGGCPDDCGLELFTPDGAGPATPQEAAAWVAYANGDPDDETVIGVDADAEDWKTVGYWASLRAAPPTGDREDPQDFLRADHPEPYGVVYWEIGNEVFGNGYYGDNYEEDLHVAYEEEEPFDRSNRRRNPALSGSVYGQGVAEFASAMKAVDPSIKIGAVLNSQPIDSWGPDWNASVLGGCGAVIDFGIVHYYPGHDPRSMLAAPRRDIAPVIENLRTDFDIHGGENPDRIEIVMTEVGSPPGLNWGDHPRADYHSLGLFALDVYLTSFEQGLVNVDWLELHNGTFLREGNPMARGPAYYGTQLANLLASPGDVLVAATSDRGPLVVHASRRADGRLGILLSNTHARGTGDAIVSVNVSGADLPPNGERYDFAPTETSAGVLVGPTPVDGMTSPFTIELVPFQATLFVMGEAS
jgi:hypothetical protein